MYYDEQIINGVLCHRSDPKGEWIPFSENELALMYLESKRANAFYSSTITRQAELIRLLREDGERLADYWWIYDEYEEKRRCVYCRKDVLWSNEKEDYICDHEQDCPITLHNQLKQELVVCKTCGGQGEVYWKYDDQNIGAQCDAKAPCPDCKGGQND